MAKVRDNHLGALQGKMGSNVFKIRKGKTFVASVPRKRKKEKTEPESATMTRMGLLSRFASAVCKINKLKDLWNNYYGVPFDLSEKFDNEPFQRIIAVNYPKSATNFLDTDAMLTPVMVGSIFVSNIVIDSDILALEFNVKDILLKESNTNCDFFLMIHLSHPLEKRSDKIKDNHKFIILKKSGKSITFRDKGNTFSFNFDDHCKKAFDDFSKAMVFFSIVSYKDNSPLICANALGFLLKGLELHAADVNEHARIKSIKTKKQIKAEKAKENPDFQTVIL